MIVRELIKVAKELITESDIEDLIDEYGEEKVEEAVRKVVTSSRRRRANPALRHLQNEMGKKRKTDPPESDNVQFQETDDEKKARQQSKEKALEGTKELPLVKRLVKQLSIHVSDMPGHVFSPSGESTMTDSRKKFEANPKAWKAEKSQQQDSGDKLWTRKEWESYKKEHPKTKIKPKFKD